MADAYGTDTYCGSSLQTGRLARGLINLGLSCFRHLITPRGTCQGVSDDDEEASAGIDLSGLIGQLDSDDVRSAVGPAIRGELMTDDRVRDVSTSVVAATEADGLVTYTIEVTVLPVAADTPLTLTIAVSSVSIALLGVST